MKTTIRQLAVFDAIAKLGSLAAAAERLGMSQSAASSAIHDMQIVLGRSLFVHVKGRPLQITDEGKRLQPRVRSVLCMLQDIERAQDAPIGGMLTIGATSLIAEHILPDICARFQARHPDVHIKVHEAPSIDLVGRLTRFELETALIENSPDIKGFELMPWRSDELWLVTSAEHPLAGRNEIALSELKGERWCLREFTSTTAARLRWLLHEALGQLLIAFESNSNEALRQAVLRGTGIGCLSRTIVEGDIAAGRMARLNVKNFRYTRSLSFVRPKSMQRSQAAAAFDAFLLDEQDMDLTSAMLPT